MTLGDYAQEIVDYLCKKIPGIDPATVLEVAEFATMKANNYVQDEIKKNNSSWFDAMKKHDEFLYKLYERK